MVLHQVRALRQSGHKVVVIGRSTDVEIRQRGYKIRAAWRQISGLDQKILEEVELFSPDIVHVHNLVPNIGWRWLNQWNGPIVYTAHNYRSVCSNGLLYRDGNPCTKCLDAGSWSAIRHSCYQDSAISTIPIAVSTRNGLSSNGLFQRADAVVCLTTEARDNFHAWGAKADKLHVIPNGIDAAHIATPVIRNGRWLTLGRLSPEKGIAKLVSMWPDEQQLDVIGDGPDREHIQMIAGDNVHLLGSVENRIVREILPFYQGLVIPSLCREMWPTVAMEALAAGTPIIPWRGNAAAILAREGLGATYETSEDLRDALYEVMNSGATLRADCVQQFQQRFTTSKWVEKINQLYYSLV